MIVSFPESASQVFAIIRKGVTAVWLLGLLMPLDLRAETANHAHPQIGQQDRLLTEGQQVTPLATLISEVLQNNPEIQAALREREAAQQRISPAEALDDPMLEAGVVNAPLASSPFNRDDMTMKMIGLSQRFPFPGKRGLRKEVASRDAQAIDHGYQETVNRIVRDLKVTYLDLGLTLEMTKLVEKNKLILEDFTHLAVDHYQAGMGAQADAFKAQTQVSRMQDELLRLARERPVIEAELIRVLGRHYGGGSLNPTIHPMQEVSLNLDSLRETAFAQRPQLLALQSLVARNQKTLELARKDYYPDFDVRLSYGQRDSMLDGSQRPDMVTMTVAINLPVWRANKIEPRIAESLAMHQQALDLYQAQSNEIAAKLRQQVATAEQNFKSARLYRTAILPQARLSVESAQAAYKVNRVDFLTLLDSQMTVFNYEISLITAIANYHKALAEIDLLIGKSPDEFAHLR
ncbi:Outer membrane protein TolC [Nitrosomonas nitrosa]|uniref:Outer membrane protein TolC n=1 Tax=Nitrosomonas nitrosa TaxID=52442 RepID=A0A8H8YWA3_9PROT|nr:TolC family protein [Nitrosomonas nitrosa]CAE6482874.1 Outer membrane protein TolC [Nitrosomonas nitrosa]